MIIESIDAWDFLDWLKKHKPSQLQILVEDYAAYLEKQEKDKPPAAVSVRPETK